VSGGTGWLSRDARLARSQGLRSRTRDGGRPMRFSGGARSALRGIAIAAAALLFTLGLPLSSAHGLQPVAWRLEQPRVAAVPAGLGTVGDIEFWAPDRGLLITAGNPPTIPPGVWAYNGLEWHEIAEVCGGAEAQGGRIAWAGPGEFWTVSVGRPGQAGAANERHEPPPLIDNTLCHFAGGQVVGSYAHPAFEANSYLTMQGAGCLQPSDCWFAGDALASPQVGAFQLHWNGSSLEAEPFLGEGHPIEGMMPFERRLYDGVDISKLDAIAGGGSGEPPAVHWINALGVQPTQGVEPELPLYSPHELPEALGALGLSAAEGSLWGAAGPKSSESPEPGQVTVIVRRHGQGWSQLIGPSSTALPPILAPEAEAQLLGGEAKAATVTAIAAEPGTNSAWIGLAAPEGSGADARAVLVHISAEGKVLETQTLPNAETEPGAGPKGAAAKLACPAQNDCWLVTTQGWLFHLAPEQERTLLKDPAEGEYFDGLITYRPPDQGLPQVPPDAPPADDSGLPEGPPPYGELVTAPSSKPTEERVAVPLLSRLRSRLIHGSTLEFRFHLAVKARVRLIAKRRRQLVAQTPMRTLKAGNRSLLLRLNPRRWPTKLGLQTHALAKLPTRPAGGEAGGGSNTVSTGLTVLPGTPFASESGPLR
jgi:hypothetical protein